MKNKLAVLAAVLLAGCEGVESRCNDFGEEVVEGTCSEIRKGIKKKIGDRSVPEYCNSVRLEYRKGIEKKIGDPSVPEYSNSSMVECWQLDQCDILNYNTKAMVESACLTRENGGVVRYSADAINLRVHDNLRCEIACKEQGSKKGVCENLCKELVK